MDEKLNIEIDDQPQGLLLAENKPLQNQIGWGWLLLISLVLGSIIAGLTYKQRAGMQWLIFIVLFELSLFVFALLKKERVPFSSIILAIINIAIATVTIIRSESFTTILAVLSNLVGLGLLAGTFLNGQWLVYRLREYVVEGLRLSLSMMAGFFRLFFKDDAEISKLQSIKVNSSQNWKALKPYLIGLLIALPILLVFGALFASADAVFADKAQVFFSWLRIENLADLIQPVILALIIAYISYGAIAFAFTRGANRQAVIPDQPLFKPFLGTTESMVVLVLLNMLFASFLFIQLRYFFGGGANISITGYTYSEYARRGFFELLAVALFAGGLHWGLNAVTNREQAGQKMAFALAVTVLYLQVAVVLVSAYNRMGLYIQAYGLTQERLLPQIFMVVLAGILLALLVMEWRKRFDKAAIVLTLSLFIFTALVAGMNLDRSIARHNLDLAKTTGKFDGNFAVGRLSVDAVPTLFEAYDDKALPAALHETLGKVLACKAARLGPSIDTAEPWFATNLVNLRAKSLFDAHRLELADYTFESKDGISGIQFPEGFEYCDSSYNID